MGSLKALVLAGGESRRMGQDKAALVIDGQTQLARTVALARSIASETFVSVRDSASSDALRLAYPTIEDATPGAGPMAGILAALRTDPTSDWLVLACDLPGLDAATLETLVAHASEEPAANALAIASEHNSELPEPLCAIWRSAMIPLVTSRLNEGKGCARKCLLLADATLVAPVTLGALDNMNTPADAKRWNATRVS
ncbi:MAG: molybdenum cofactor guanylyltransferase [Pseudomonadota bacterium]